MKKLLNKSTIPFLGFTSITVLLSIPLFYLATQYIVLNDTDESLLIAKQKFEDSINENSDDHEKILQELNAINGLKIGYEVKPAISGNFPIDSLYTTNRYDNYHGHVEPFRILETIIEINNVPFLLKIEMDMEEYYDIIPYIAIVAGLFFLMILTGFYLINRHISFKIWHPFYQMLDQLEGYQISGLKNFVNVQTDIFEFSKLQSILNTFIDRNKALFLEQKSFTENASHELQTPLAIIKNKLDLLLQKETVTDRQYQIIEEINRALTRITRINKNLLLLAKIENNQFDDNETIEISQLTQQCLAQLGEHADNKNIAIQTDIAHDVLIEGNKTLIEILLNNLLLNAIRHNLRNGTIAISLNKKELNIANSGNTALTQSAIFKRFAKVSNDGVGNGLGLAIISQICNRHNWTINYLFTYSTHCFSIRF